MTRDDINRWEAEIDSWRQRYEALLKTLADSKSLATPMMLADKQSYELGLFHGSAAEREACAKVCDDKAKETFSGQCQVWGDYFARAIRARSQQ